MSYFCSCPRCGDRSFERLQSYSHCPQCLYVEDDWQSPESDYLAAEKILQEFEQSSLDEGEQVESNVIEFPIQSESSPIGA